MTKRALVNQSAKWCNPPDFGSVILSLVLVWIGGISVFALGGGPVLLAQPVTPGAAKTLLLSSQQVVLATNATTSLSVQIHDVNGQPVPGVMTNFSASAGTVDPATVVSDADGIATALYTANNEQGQVIITVTADDITSTAYLDIRNPAPAMGSVQTVTVIANANQQKPGTQVEITATVLDSSGQPMQGELVTFFGSLGEIVPASSITDADGRAVAIFTAGNANGLANIVALVGYYSGKTQLQVLGEPVATATPIPGNQNIYLPSIAR